MKAILYTIIALIAFAANSLFCRMALAEGYIDPWNFTVIRLISGAVCLGIVMAIYTAQLKHKDRLSAEVLNEVLKDRGSWLSSISLLIYALSFSIAYVQLDTGTGAIILFSAVQLTMIGWGIYKKEQLSALQWSAFMVAIAGFFYLMLPSAAAPSSFAAVLMAISGTAWGIYSIRGRACLSPLRTTGFNFIRSLVAIPLLLLIGMSNIKNITIEGIVLAAASGAIASGIGYSIWYVAMPLLKNIQAAVVQLCVPILAAVAGLLLLAEPLTISFMLVSAVILGAVLVFIMNKKTVI